MMKKTGKKFLKYAKRALACAVVLSLMTGTALAATPAVPSDVAGSAHKDAITALIEANVITGSTDGLFHPFDNLTRAQACVIIVKAINPPNAEVAGTPTQKVPASGFSDMKGYGWADGYVSYAVRHNIVTGYPDGTFKPGNNVTYNEMLTMVLRASGFADAEIGTNWPKDFIAKAEAEGITKGLDGELPKTATKEIAARMTYNKLETLRESGTATEETANTESENTSWGLENLTFETGKFNDNMTLYNGTAISSKVVVYTYGVKADYKKEMKLPTKEGEYRKDTINKYKLADTPCFYVKTGKEITLMVLPTDAGFSGRIYCVINGGSKTTNGKGDSVNSIDTLAAAQKVEWLTKDTTIEAPASTEYLKGEIYELTATDGTIKSIAKAGNGNQDFKEITTGDWAEVKDLSDGIITLVANDKKFATEDKSVVYVLESDGKSYKVGRLDNINEGDSIRAFSISDKGEIASYITVKKK